MVILQHNNVRVWTPQKYKSKHQRATKMPLLTQFRPQAPRDEPQR